MSTYDIKEPKKVHNKFDEFDDADGKTNFQDIFGKVTNVVKTIATYADGIDKNFVNNGEKKEQKKQEEIKKKEVEKKSMLILYIGLPVLLVILIGVLVYLKRR